MLIGIQIVMRLETYENEATQSTHVKAKTNKNQGSWVAALHTLEQVCLRMSLACVRRLDHAYVDPYLENLIYIETKQKQKPNKT